MNPMSWAGWGKQAAALLFLLPLAFFSEVLAEGHKELDTGFPPKPVEQTSTTEQSVIKSGRCDTAKTEGDTWLDLVHALVQDKTCEPAVWFDNFFGEDHVLPDLRPGTFIILRNTARLTEGFDITYAADFYLTLDLPKLEKSLKRVRLYIESGSDADKYTVQPGDPVKPGIDETTGDSHTVIGVRVDPYVKPRSLISIDSGIKITMHPDAFIRIRSQYSKSFSDVYLIRISEIAMWRAIEHFSNTVQLDIERGITDFTLVQWGNSMTYIEGTAGVAWNTGISLFTQVTPKSAISFDTSMWGVNHPVWTIQNYRVGSLYRLNFYRPWLFLEISPEVTWPEDESGRRDASYVLMSALEIQFGR